MWNAEVVEVLPGKTDAKVLVRFTDGTKTEEISFLISDPDSLPLICWNQIKQYESIDDIQNTKTILGPVDVSGFRPNPSPPVPDPVVEKWKIDYQNWRKMQLAIVQKLKTDTDKDYTDLTVVVMDGFKAEYLQFLLP